MDSRKRFVMMIGTSPSTRGGIASVVSAYRAGGLFERLPVKYLATHADRPWFGKLIIAIGACLAFMWQLICGSDFVLHVHASSRASFWRKCVFIYPALWLRRPAIVHLHGSEFMQFYWQECGAARKALIRRTLDRCTRILVLSESWRKDLAGITANPNVEVLVNPALRSRRLDSIRERQRETVLFLGRLGRRKGIYVLLAALATVKIRFPEVLLLCGGDGEVEEVRAEADKSGLLDNVRILGWVHEPEKVSLLESASIYVLPSFAEGLPMSILEAMAAGLPVISTPVGGIPEVITHGTEGLLVPAGDAAALSDAICRLLGDPSLCEEMGRNCQARFEREFSIESVLARLEAIYAAHGVTPCAGKATALS